MILQRNLAVYGQYVVYQKAKCNYLIKGD